MNLIHKEDAVVRVLQQAGLVAGCSCEAPFYVAEQIGREQLCVVVVLGAVKGQKGSVGLQDPLGDCILPGQLGDMAFSYAGVTLNQDRKAVWRIFHGNFHLVDDLAQAAVGACQRGKDILLLASLGL